MTAGPLKHIAIFGGGLAGQLCALALAKHMPDSIAITLINDPSTVAGDLFFGTLAPAATYDFFLSIGITEPELLLNTRTCFSLGTEFKDWGEKKRAWKLVFHRPLPIHNGVQFHHYLNHMTPKTEALDLSPYVMSAVAADNGVFAHPPEGKNIPLAALEYGYHLDPEDMISFLSTKVAASRIQIVEDSVGLNKPLDAPLEPLRLKCGSEIDADLFIDCSHHQNSELVGNGMTIYAQVNRERRDDAPKLLRQVTETDNNIQAKTTFRAYTHTLSITDGADLSDAAQTISLGRLETPWEQNVVKLGVSAGAFAPLTDAPLRLLLLDIQRLLELIPTSQNMKVEAREFNRRFRSDFDLAEMFQRTLFEGDGSEGSMLRRKIETQTICDRLSRKLTQYESRGALVNFDNEPYQDHDWVSLHTGMGRRPRRYDPLTIRIPDPQIEQILGTMRLSIAQMSAKMPPYETYMTRFLAFLKDKHG